MANDFLYRDISATLSFEKFHRLGVLHTVQPIGIIPSSLLINEVFTMSRSVIKSSTHHEVVSDVHINFLSACQLVLTVVVINY